MDTEEYLSSLNLPYETLVSSGGSDESEHGGKTLLSMPLNCSEDQWPRMSWILPFPLNNDSVLNYLFYFMTWINKISKSENVNLD